MNVDEIQKIIRKKSKKSVFKAIIDSSWILELPHMSDCNYAYNIEDCPIYKLFQQTFE
jgi:hypothetical protein